MKQPQKSVGSVGCIDPVTIYYGTSLQLKKEKTLHLTNQRCFVNIGYVRQLNTHLLEQEIGAFRLGTNDVLCFSIQQNQWFEDKILFFTTLVDEVPNDLIGPIESFVTNAAFTSCRNRIYSPGLTSSR